MGILELIVVGLIVGAVARLIIPGRQPIGIILTLLSGIVGALLGRWIATEIFNADVNRYPFLWAIGGAVLVVLVVSKLLSGRSRGWGWR
ncbi:MAG: GlsB/YeaQ/YmgE family stress response membrane protein [Actinobacteria bacterium]|nr:GlsB/YeaQ/YmgE family stress response membrane protein [Actinomycetota bacterium]